jgi:hypothetical protein
VKISADIADTIREHLYDDKTASSRESSSRVEGTCRAMLASALERRQRFQFGDGKTLRVDKPAS